MRAFANPVRYLPAIFLGLLLMGCCWVPAPGSQRRRTSTADVLVFNDLNLNGTWEEGEAAIADAMVIGESNEHGAYTRETALTDDEGRATLNARYTHYFWVGALPPCGYTPTSDTEVRMHEEGHRANLEFGFQPETPRTGRGRLHFSVWHDLNRDGIRQETEPPLRDFEVRVDLHLLPWASDAAFGVNYNDLATETDGEGRAVVELGNSCGTAWVVHPPEWLWQTTAMEPAGSWEDGEMELSYDVGRTEINWGLAKPSEGTEQP